MLDEVKVLEPKFKQLLYGAVEHVQATKAALYLAATADLNDKIYELVTAYGFNDPSRRIVRGNDDLIDRLVVKRNAFFVNGVGSDMRFSEMLFRQSTDKLLAAPLFSRGRLVGFLDMRDKAGKKPFDAPDLDAARKIADDVLALLGANKLFGLAPIPLVELDPQSAAAASQRNSMPTLVLPATSPAAAPAPSAAPPPVAMTQKSAELSPQAARAIEAAREFMSRRQHAAATQMNKRVLTERDLDVVHLLLPSMLAIPGAVLACFSALGHINNPQGAVAVANVSEDAMEMLQAHLQAWLKQANQPHMTKTPHVIYPFGVQALPVSAAGISAILTAPLTAQSVEGLVLTVAFERTAEAQAQRALYIFMRQVETSLEAAMSGGAATTNRQLIAEKLLEPDFQKYPELVEHSRNVALLAQRFAVALELSSSQVETIRIAALVHDVGLRLLDYERLYRRANLTPEEMRGLAEHPIIGAALVEPLLGSEIAQAVLRHHERVDGRGYPSRISGQQIPLASRIIQICDAWVAMTSRNSYQMPRSNDEAARKLREGAGTQFDDALVGRYLAALPQIVT